MKKLLVAALSMWSISTYARDNRIVIGTVDSIYSTILKQPRKIWVHMPDTSGNFLYGQKRYPVVFLLDGEAFFYAAAGTTQFLSTNTQVCPEMILVGINSGDRMHDLTPWHDTTVPKDSNLVRSSGGGEQFTAFLEKELIPYIDANYPTAPYRMLVGHSLGGLLVLNTLIKHTELFNSYVAIDPATYWAGQKLLEQAGPVLQQKNFINKSLYVGLSGTLPADTDSLMMDKTLATVAERSDIQFDALVNGSVNNGLQYRRKYFEQENHNSVPFPAMYDALHFLFDFMPMPAMKRDTVTTAAYMSHYKMISQKMGYTLLPPEDEINGMGYYFLQKKMFEKAFSFFQMNIDNYPESYNVYDSMSDLYVAENNKEKAIAYLEKELALKDAPYIREKLARMKGDK